MAQSILQRSDGGSNGAVISQVFRGQRLSDGQSCWSEPHSSYSQDFKGGTTSEGQETQPSSVNKGDNGVFGAAIAACQRFLSSCWTCRPNRAERRVVAEAVHRTGLQTVKAKNTNLASYLASEDHEPSEKLGVEDFNPQGDRTPMGRGLVTLDLEYDSAQDSGSTVGAEDRPVSVARTTEDILFCTCYRRQDSGRGLNQASTDVPCVIGGTRQCLRTDVVSRDPDGTGQADEYWEWNAEKQQWRHWDQDLGEWIVCPDEFD